MRMKRRREREKGYRVCTHGLEALVALKVVVQLLGLELQEAHLAVPLVHLLLGHRHVLRSFCMPSDIASNV